MSKSKAAVSSLPHSWAASKWPDHVFPNNQRAAMYLIRAHRAELLRHRALERIGRTLIVFGAGFSAFLASQSGRVEGYEIAPNRTSESTAA
jgi:hypothetical protein